MIDNRLKKRDIKLNLTAVLDATFILTFFLLQSAQFLDVYEIGSDAPTIKTIDTKKDKRDPLNLTLEINNAGILVKIGFNVKEKVVARVNRKEDAFDIDHLQATLIRIKQANPEETAVILRPEADVTYPDLVQIMDTAREIRRSKPPITINGKDNKPTETRKLFEQIIFQT
jgi:biopolymer transport protein ExbD